MVEYRCPVCGKPVLPTFKFCKACGARLPKNMFKGKTEPEAELHATSFGSEAITATESTEEDYSLSEDIVYALAVKGRLILIDKEMEEILEEIENLEERVKVGLVPKEDAKSRVDELNKRFVEIKLEKKQLKKKTTPIPIFELIDKKETAKERLKKLKGLKSEKSISQKTYEKMEREYRKEIASAERAITDELIKMERWKDQLKKELAQKREMLETLFVRKSTGEITDKEYNKEREELTEEIKNWEAALEELQKTLKKLK